MSTMIVFLFISASLLNFPPIEREKYKLTLFIIIYIILIIKEAAQRSALQPRGVDWGLSVHFEVCVFFSYRGFFWVLWFSPTSRRHAD